MEVLDATSLTERLKWEAKEYWLHLEADSPLEKYPAKQHARRVQEKLGYDEGLIYLAGQPARNNEDSDMPAPFRQRRYFYYLSGCDEPGCHLAYDIRQDALTLFIPRIDPKRVIWNGRGPTRAEAIDKYDIDAVHYVDQLPGFVHEWASCYGNKHANLYVLHHLQVPPGLPDIESRIDSVTLQPAMNIARMVKDDHEIDLIRKANDISSQAHREVLASILNFKNEAQVEGLFMDVCISQQAKQQAYDPIAASGPNAGTLHYDANNEDFGKRQLMCLDAGCEYKLYASDITRTFPLSASWPSKEAENIYKLVERMQETCIKGLAPGVRYLDLHILAHQIAIDGLLQLGILHNGTREEIFKAGTSRAFFPHGLGHHVGLEVHDVGQAELMSVRRGKLVYEQAPSLYPENFHLPVYDPKTCLGPTDPHSSYLEEGMVVTVEPGIYFSVYALQHFYLPSPIHSNYINAETVQRYLPVGGVRIEDDILITAKSYENLTKAPKGDAMLDIIRSRKPNTIMTPKLTRKASRRSHDDEESPLLRAPGIPSETPELMLKPLARTSTMPPEFKQRGSVDFEPFDGPSLFSNFKRSMTTEEKIQRWRQSHGCTPIPNSPSTTSRKPIPVCGESNPHLKHVYMSTASHFGSLSRDPQESEGQRACKNCTILVQTLDRLRQNLNSSAQSSPTVEQNPIFVLPPKTPDSRQTRIDDLAARLQVVKDAANPASPTRKHGEPEMVRFRESNNPWANPTSRSQIQHNRHDPWTNIASLNQARVPSHVNPMFSTLPSRSLNSRRSLGILRATQLGEKGENVLPTIPANQTQHRPESINPLHASNTRGHIGDCIPFALPVVNNDPLEHARKEIEGLKLRLESLERPERLTTHHQERSWDFKGSLTSQQSLT